ncbi:hypothetical protein GOV05_04915 [Candidatus Woesearchaeota archaeon]|nr:hypothetical protein [Candidatus Woesearchaeota archaeon]
MGENHVCDDNCEHEVLGAEELALGAHDKVDALIDLLIKKGVFKEEEYSNQIKELLKEYGVELE